jgi:regulator of sirC expression with transglutaminase-like and TPR domain
VRIKARHIQLLEARYAAYEAWEAARGTPREFDALCATSRADNAVRRVEAKIERLRELRAQLRQLNSVTT